MVFCGGGGVWFLVEGVEWCGGRLGEEVLVGVGLGWVLL